MASQDFDATETPQNIVSVLGLVIGTRYLAQNLSTINTLKFRESPGAPDASARAFRIESGGVFSLEPQTGVGFWIWSDDAAGCPVVVSEHI